MATLTAANPELVQSDEHMETITKLILNGTSWKAGQFLFTDTNDYVKVCESDADASTGGVKYLALKDQADPGNQTTTAEVGVITQDMIFRGNELNGAVAKTAVGTAVALDVTSNICTLDLDDTGNDAFEITDVESDFDPQYDIADTLAKIRFKVLPAALEAAQA